MYQMILLQKMLLLSPYRVALHEPVVEFAARRDNLDSREAAPDIVSLHRTLVGSTEGGDSLSPVEAASQRERAAFYISHGPQSWIQRLRTS